MMITSLNPIVLNKAIEILEETKSGAGFKSYKQQKAVMAQFMNRPGSRIRKGGSRDIFNDPKSIVKAGDQFFTSVKEITDPKTLKRLKEMNLPPAWRGVHINPDPKASLMAFGLDSKDRLQSRYSTEHTGKSSEQKFTKMKKFGASLSNIRSSYAKALKSPSASDREAGLALMLIDKTFIRGGSDRETKAAKKSYGASTLQARHVKFSGSKALLEFVGKKGVTNTATITDPKLVSGLKRQVAGKTGEDKVFPNTSLDKMNSLLGKSGKFTVKDFRTYHGTRLAYEALESIPVSTLKDAKVAYKTILGNVSVALNNTPAVAKKNYINPVVWAPLAKLGVKL